jgi:hypothetical protein
VAYPKRNIVSHVEVLGNQVTVHPGPCLEGLVRREFSVEYDAPIDLRELDTSILVTPYVLNVVPALWVLGGTHVVDSMDEDLFDSLERVKNGFRTLYPDVPWEGRLVPEQLVRNARRERRTPRSRALFYSGGVDSTFSALHCDPEETVLLTVQGHDVALDNERGWKAVCDRLQGFARGFGFATTRVRANVFRLLRASGTPDGHPELKPWYGRVQHGIGLCGLAFPLASYNGWEDIAFSSFVGPDGEPFQWGSNLLLEPQLVVNGVQVVSIGEETDWVDKVFAISDAYRRIGSTPHPLRICLQGMAGNAVENCCDCDKCLRGIVALIVRSENPRAWGFRVPEPLHETVRRRVMSMWLPDYNLHHWQRLQKAAVSALGEATDASREFLSWLPTWDFGKNTDRPRSRVWPRSSGPLRRVLGRLFGP